MKKTIQFSLLFVFLGALVLVGQSAGFLENFGMGAEEAQGYALNTLDSGVVPYEILAGTFKEMPVPQRIEMVRSFVVWAKGFAKTPSFRKAYQEWRTEKKPQPPEIDSPDDQIKSQQSEFQKSIEEMKKASAQLPPEQRKEMEKAIAEMVKQTQAMNKDQDLQAAMRQGAAEQAKQQQADFQAALKKWEADYPTDINRLIAKRLKSFLDLSATVDFTAKLQQSGENKIFANEAYEAKPPEWKVCYRAGKEVVGALRADVSTWLKELEGSAAK